ncbi:MAG: MFS transporter [Acidobacteria bacterium]|nr:MFS transporter [Acidobacteriota bacterium]
MQRHAIVTRLLGRLAAVRPDEVRHVGWAFLYLFAVFSAYYVIRPIRDEAGVAGGVNNLSWLFSGTLIAMMAVNAPFAAMVKRLPRSRFIGLTYRFFIANLLVFLVLFQSAPAGANVWIGRVFFIWTSVFNLFVVSVFWAFMVDVFTTEQGKRLFGFIAAAATLGGIAGSSITAGTVQTVGVPVLLLVSATLLEVGVRASRRLGALSGAFDRRAAAAAPDSIERGTAAASAQRPIGGSVMAGLTHAISSPYLLNIAIYMLLYSVLSTFLYFQQAEIVDRSFADRGARTAFFARVDLLVNALTLGCQFFLTGRVMKAAGVPLTLTFVPAVTVVGFLWLGMVPTAAVVVGFTVLRRAGNFSFARPTREVLFTVVSREDKYKAKSFIDTVVYRLGDQVGAWASAGIAMATLGAGAIAWAAVPLAAAWVANAWWLGRRQERLARETADAAAGRPAADRGTPVAASS